MEYQTYSQDQTSLGELFSRLSTQASTLIHQEIQLAQAEMTRKASKAGRNAALIAIGGVIGLGAYLALVAALILALAQVMDAWLAALIVGVVLAIAAAIAVQYGVTKLKEIDPTPRRTVETMRENKEWLTEQI